MPPSQPVANGKDVFPGEHGPKREQHLVLRQLALILHIWFLPHSGSWGSRKTWVWVVRILGAGGSSCLVLARTPLQPTRGDLATSPWGTCPGVGLLLPFLLFILSSRPFCFLICLLHMIRI